MKNDIRNNKSDSYRTLGFNKITAPNLNKEQSPKATVIKSEGDLRGGKK